jgi:hypothetical protein
MLEASVNLYPSPFFIPPFSLRWMLPSYVLQLLITGSQAPNPTIESGATWMDALAIGEQTRVRKIIHHGSRLRFHDRQFYSILPHNLHRGA